MPSKIEIKPGDVFTSWTVLREDGKDKHGAIFQLCECACGNQSRVRSNMLSNGRSTGCKSCGTTNSNLNRAPELTGRRFGRLLVLGYGDDTGNGNHRLKCKCDCGNEVLAVPYSLRSGNTKSCGCWKKEERRTRKVSGDAF